MFVSTSAGEEQDITAMEVASALDPRHRGMTMYTEETRDGIEGLARQLLPPQPIDVNGGRYPGSKQLAGLPHHGGGEATANTAEQCRRARRVLPVRTSEFDNEPG